MSDTGLIVPGMTGTLSRYDVTITVDRDGGYLSNPAEFAAAAEQAASSRNASVVTATRLTGPRPWPSSWPSSPQR
jgi:hypothetical protein